MKRKIFAAFLSLMMVISMLPTSAFATEVDVPADCQHENAHWETVKEATCTVAGVKSAHCPDCDKDVEDEIPATGHAPKEEWVVVDESYVPADCEHAGHETYVCPNCGGQEKDGSETRDIKEDPALGHDIKKTIVNPTCKDGGYTLEECTRGDHSEKTNFTDPTGKHNMVLVSELRKADCKTGTNGIGRYACSVCGESGGYQVIPAEHVKEEDKANSKAATCKDEGKIAYKCSVCGKELESEVVPVTDEHTLKEDVIPATCTENEKVGKKCLVCGKVFDPVEKPGTALGHDEQIDKEKSKDATCTEAGVEVIKCKRCGEVLENIEIPATGHKWKSTGLHEADCKDAAGEKFVCENDSNHTYVEPFTGDMAEPKKDHTPVPIPAVPATCTTTGWTEGTKCADCHEILTAPVETPIDKNAHKPVVAKVLKAGECGENSIVRMECELCHENLGYEVQATEHVFDKLVEHVDPNCGKAGKDVYRCSKCDDEKAIKTVELPPVGEHKFIEDEEHMVTVSKATCTEDEVFAYKCSVCGETGEPQKLHNSALGHKYVEKTDDPDYKKGNCEEDGLIVKVCATCGDRQTDPKPATGKHQWNNGKDKPATCTTPGGATYTCLKCGKEHFEEYTGTAAEPAKGHTPEVMPKVDATCSTTGLTEGSKCAVCHEILKAQEPIPVVADAHTPVVAKELRKAVCGGQTGIVRLECKDCHTFLHYEVISNDHIPVEATHVDATCGKDGEVTFKCSRCGEALPEMDKVIPATGKHTFDKNDKDETHFDIVDPTCTEPGKVTPKCLVCGAKIESEATTVGTALGHVPEINKEDPEYKAATCEEDGLDTYKCKRCGEKLEPKVVPAKGEHKWGVGTPVDATCEKDQHVVEECSICHKTREVPVPGGQKALGHDYKKVVHPATCKAAGYTEVTCAREGCGYKDTIPGDPANPDNHTYGEPYHLRPATCEKTGIDKFTCVDCGDVKYEVAEKLAHTLLDENAQVTKEPTCVADGEITNKCTKCGTVVTEPIPATGKHTPVVIPETDTMSAGEKCSVCGTILKEPVKKADCEHKNLVPIDEVPATCTSTGLSVGLKCADCDKVIEPQTVIPKLDHTVKVLPAKEATCTEDGLTAGEECSVCHTVLKAQETVKAAGHKAVEVPAVEATCSSTGLTAGEKCSVCNEVLKAQETVPMKDHTVVEVPAVEATCTATGLTAGEECSVCHKVLKAQETVPMKEHTEKIIEAVAATCTEAGHKEGVKCSVCGTILMEPETVEALGHDFTEYVGAGEDDKGAYIEYKCSRCDATEKQYAE